MENWRQEVRGGIIEQLRKPVLIGIVLIVGIYGLTSTRWFRGKSSSTELEVIDQNKLPDNYPTTSKILPKFNLIDQNGQAITNEMVSGHPTIITFAFAHCTAVCPVLIRNVNMALSTADGVSPRALIISLDPERDTLEELPELAKQWELAKETKFVSGDIQEIERVLAEFGVPHPVDSKTGEMTHPALVYVTNLNGEIVYAFNDPSVAWMAQALARAGR